MYIYKWQKKTDMNSYWTEKDTWRGHVKTGVYNIYSACVSYDAMLILSMLSAYTAQS